MSTAVSVPAGRRAAVRRVWRTLDPAGRRAALMMAAVILALHVIGFATLFLLVVPGHYHLGSRGTCGIGITAYTLGMRHAFDADHIAAIDNTTRTLLAERRQPMTVGFWFSLGHSSVVFTLALLIALGVRALDGPVTNGASTLHRTTSIIGTVVSGGFLYLIAAINLVILVGILRVWRDMRNGSFDEQQLEQQLAQRGLLNRLLGGLTRRVSSPAHMYPIGILFGLGFDTATEVALLVTAGTAGAIGLPWYTILCLPVLFAAGMVLLDSLDGSFMNLAYGWAFAKPVRRVFYNLTVTGLSIGVALLIGTVELGSLLASELKLSGPFWRWFAQVNLNLLGLAIVGLFVLTFAVALLVWRLGRLEDRFSS